MDPKHREIIEEYRNLLASNLILTDDFYRVLETHGVFSEQLVKDIKTAPKGENKSVLINLLLTRTTAGFGKFCDVLEVTGHHFLSDCLREAENLQSLQDLDIEELFKRFPFVSKSIKSDAQKEAIRDYFKEKIHGEVIKQTWKGDMAAKERLILARQKQIEQIWHFEEETKIKDKSIADLQSDYMKLQKYADDLRREIKTLHKHIEDMEHKHKDDLLTQVKFNMANDRQLTRLNERAEDAGSILSQMHAELRNVMGKSYVEKPARTAYQNLQDNMAKFLKHHTDLSGILQRFREERVYLSNHITGATLDDEQSIKPHFQSYVVRSEEANGKLLSQLSELELKLGEVTGRLQELQWVQQKLESEKAAGENNSVNYVFLEKEVFDVTNVLKKKEEKIQTLESEIAALQKKIKEIESAASVRKNSSDSSHSHNGSSVNNGEPLSTRTAKAQNMPETIEQSRSRFTQTKKPSSTASFGPYKLDGPEQYISSLDAVKGQGLSTVRKSEDSVVLGMGARQTTSIAYNGKKTPAKSISKRTN